MQIFFIIIGLILTIIGSVGALLPVLPGPLLNYIALLILQFTWGHPFSTEFLILRWGIIALVTILDYIIPIIGTKKFGGTKWWVRWSTIWLIIAVIILPILGITIGPFWIIGLIWWPFLGAYIGEKMGGKNSRHALKSAFGSFLWFAAGTILKLVICIIMWIYFLIESFKIIKDMF